MVSRIALTVAFAAELAVSATAAEHEHGTQAGVQSLDVFADSGRLHLLTGELLAGSEKPVLLHRSSSDGGATWTTPTRVDEKFAPPHGLHRGMDAQIAAASDHLVAAWTTSGTDRWGSGPITLALSADGGKTWTGGRNPADDGLTTGHGFIDIATDATGAFHLTWLDNRDGRQGLRYARSTDHGRSWSANVTVKAATCECCPNTLSVGADGSVAILFRDSNPRDMGVALSRDGGLTWAAPSRVGEFAWEFNGCPHVGGGLAFTDGQRAPMHALVWTGLSEQSGVYHAASADLGAHWSKLRQLGSPTASHPDLAANHEVIAAVWDEHADGHSSIVGAVSRDGGMSWTAAMKISDPSANASHPRVVASSNGFRAFWTQVGSSGATELRSALIP